LHNLLQHLTNYSLNKLSADYIKSDDLATLAEDQASKRTLSSCFETLRLQGIDTDSLFAKIGEVCRKSLVAIQPYALREQSVQFNGKFNQAQGTCFQVVGFDIFIEKNLKTWVLEINDHPSLNILMCLEGEKGLIKSASEVDRYIKVKVIGDAIKLMRKHPKTQKVFDSFKCWHRLLPIEQSPDVFMRATHVYEALATKLHQPLSMSAFCKLAKVPALGLQKVSLELMYKRITQVNKASQMDLPMFFDALAELGGSGGMQEFVTRILDDSGVLKVKIA
jgi:hypothetical protein